MIISDTNRALLKEEIKKNEIGNPLRLEYNWKRVGPLYESTTNECHIHFGQNDQIYSWSELKNTFGNKFNAVSISADHEHADVSDNDIGEYDTLLNFAHSIGNEAWLFCTAGGYNYTYIGEFCDAAWKQGWLRKFIKIRPYYIWYKCIYNTPALCDPENPDAWFFDHYEYRLPFLQEIYQ